mgnify:CR=1 FL=1
MSSRFEMIINLDTLRLPIDKRQSVVACIIGPGGSNIKRYSKLIPGVYIRLYNNKKGKDVSVHGSQCDRIYISGRSEQDAVKCHTIIQTDMMAYMAPAEIQSTRPSFQVSCPPEIVGMIIGKNGSNLKWIQSTVGKGCFIVHNRESSCFDISAMDNAAVGRATLFIQNNIIKLNTKKEHVIKEEKVEKKSKNVYDVISYDSSDNESYEMELSDTTSSIDISSNELFPTLPKNTPKNKTSKFSYSDKYWTNVDVVKNPAANIKMDIGRKTDVPNTIFTKEETNTEFALPTFDPTVRWGDMDNDSEDEYF